MTVSGGSSVCSPVIALYESVGAGSLSTQAIEGERLGLKLPLLSFQRRNIEPSVAPDNSFSSGIQPYSLLSAITLCASANA